MNRQGFTLIELMIVVLVIGILAAVGIPKYQSFVMESRQKACMSELKSIDTTIGVWETKNIAIPYNDAAQMSFNKDGSIVGSSILDTVAWYWKSTNGIMPAGDAILQICQDPVLFRCPEVLTKYGTYTSVPGNDWRINRYWWKVSQNWGGWWDWVPLRVRRAATCFAFGYFWQENGQVTGAWWGWMGPGNNFAPGWAGPDHTRASMHLQWGQ